MLSDHLQLWQICDLAADIAALCRRDSDGKEFDVEQKVQLRSGHPKTLRVYLNLGSS